MLTASPLQRESNLKGEAQGALPRYFHIHQLGRFISGKNIMEVVQKNPLRYRCISCNHTIEVVT
jgi:hypothetical protein